MMHFPRPMPCCLIKDPSNHAISRIPLCNASRHAMTAQADLPEYVQRSNKSYIPWANPSHAPANPNAGDP